MKLFIALMFAVVSGSACANTPVDTKPAPTVSTMLPICPPAGEDHTQTEHTGKCVR